MSFEILTATKDVVLILAAITAANVAVKGLKSWAMELKGKADFEVARNLIRSTYKLRDAHLLSLPSNFRSYRKNRLSIFGMLNTY